MPTIVFKLYAGQGTKRTYRQSGDYATPFGSIKMLLVACLNIDYSVFREHYLPTSCILQRFGLVTRASNVIHSHPKTCQSNESLSRIVVP